MRVVVSQYPFAIRLMERQGVTNAIRNVDIGFDAPGLDVDPVAIALIDDRAVQVEQCFKTKVIPHALLYHQMINNKTNRTAAPIRVSFDTPRLFCIP